MNYLKYTIYLYSVILQLNESLQENNDVKLQMAAVGCLHSLSRSVQLLRTTFQDHPVWKPLISILGKIFFVKS